MKQTDAAYYKAYKSRDPRFDGVFFIGVSSTGIYCRPICPARTPKQSNCLFFASAEAAEKAFFRPCLRCRPELAPGNAPIDSAERLAYLILHHINEGISDNGLKLADISAQFKLSSRQVRRIVRNEFGVSPRDLIQTRRLLLAKQLLTETNLPVIEIAFASGFFSLRRFNDAFARCYKMPPSRLRKQARQGERIIFSTDTSTLQLVYRPPYDWTGVLNFLRLRALKGVESATESGYFRSVGLGKHQGWISVHHKAEKNTLLLEFSHSLTPVLPVLIGRIRGLFDLSARPDLIAGQLLQDSILKQSVTNNPGLRVPGAFDGFELAVRAVLGQQVTVKAATTLASRFVEKLGRKIETPLPELTHLCPSPKRIAQASIDQIAALGITTARAKCIIALAKAFESGELKLDAGVDPYTTIKQLIKLPGIGQWTAHYIAMRALRWPDAFPKEDIAIRKILGGITARQAEEMSQAWRPWRSYAVLHLWQHP